MGRKNPTWGDVGGVGNDNYHVNHNDHGNDKALPAPARRLRTHRSDGLSAPAWPPSGQAGVQPTCRAEKAGRCQRQSLALPARPLYAIPHWRQ